MVRLLTVQASSDPRTPINTRGILLPHLNSSPRKQRQGVPRASWLARLEIPGNLGLIERACLHEVCGGVNDEGKLQVTTLDLQKHASTSASTHTYIHM